MKSPASVFARSAPPHPVVFRYDLGRRWRLQARGLIGRFHLFACTGALGFLFELGEVLDNVSGIDTTFQRNGAPSFCSSNRVNTCVPKGAPEFRP